MVFNWFRRKFDEQETPPAEPPAVTPTDESTDATEAADDATDADEAETPDTSTAAAPGNEAYLEWAKAAFQNIQQRQTDDTAAAPEPETQPATTDTEATDSADEPAAEPSDVEAVETAETAEIADEPKTADEPETAAEPKTAPSTTAASTTDTEAAATGKTSETSEPAQPAWMRAAAERQARLDRLQASAIEESEAFEQLPDRGGVSGELELDDDFVWSAEVLAAQGRSAEDVSLDEIEWLTKLRQGLGKTRIGLVNNLKSIVGQGPLNEDAVMEIEALLLQADVGVDATEAIVEALQAKMREETLPPDEAIAYLKQVLRDMLEQPFERHYDRDFSPMSDCLNIWMMTGVNGAGKTTTIGKLTHMAKSSGYDCLIAAADTFRAAAVEQVKVWGERTQTDVIANPGQNTDPAAVVFDAIEAAKARHTDLLLVDTAGRLQNKKNLMDELSKMRRIVDKKAPNARVESLLVLDATLGQNGLRQAEVFAEAAQLSGVVLTKLDGSARGGVALAVVRQLGLPIRFVGAGEGIEDLRPFSSYEFVEALLDG